MNGFVCLLVIHEYTEDYAEVYVSIWHMPAWLYQYSFAVYLSKIICICSHAIDYLQEGTIIT